MHDAILIADHYQRLKEATERHQKVDPNREAQGLSMLIKPFGRYDRRIAIVNQDDSEGLTAYQRAGFETLAVNGNRPTELRRFIQQIDASLETAPPKHLVIASTDPAFSLLCARTARNRQTAVAVWAPANCVPPELTDPAFGFRPLEELLPDLKVSRLDIRLDYENLHIGLQRRGSPPEPKHLVEAVKAAVSDLGEIITITAYGDWSALAQGGSNDIQRELALLGVETRYQVNIRGKNSADMKIADDIRTLVEKDSGAPDAVDAIVLGTCDRDFRPSVESAKARGKRIVLLALQGGLSRELERVATEVRYLDKHLTITPAQSSTEALPLQAKCSATID